MRLNLFIDTRDPKVAAELLNEKARLKLEKRVYVRAHTRAGPRQWFQTAREHEVFAKQLAEKKKAGKIL